LSQPLSTSDFLPLLARIVVTADVPSRSLTAADFSRVDRALLNRCVFVGQRSGDDGRNDGDVDGGDAKIDPAKYSGAVQEDAHFVGNHPCS
jgi:hypothetical protein